MQTTLLASAAVHRAAVPTGSAMSTEEIKRRIEAMFAEPDTAAMFAEPDTAAMFAGPDTAGRSAGAENG